MKMKKLAILILSLASLGVFCQILPAQEVDVPDAPDVPVVDQPGGDNDARNENHPDRAALIVMAMVSVLRDQKSLPNYKKRWMLSKRKVKHSAKH